MTAPPRESQGQGKKLYGELAEYLSKITGKKIVYKHPRDWLRYQRDIRRDRFDIIFDGPHFASWRILHQHHEPLAKLPGTLDFYFLTHKGNETINETVDMELRKICVIPPPNLTSLVLLNILNSPVREPLLVSVKGGMGAVIKELDKKECEAGVVRKDFFDKKLNDEQKAKYKIIYQSRPIPNQVFTASPRVSRETQEIIIAALTKDEVAPEVKKLLVRFAGKNIKSFETATKQDLEGQNRLLEGVILGW